MRGGDGFHLDFAQVVLSEYDDDKHLGLSLDHYGEAESGGQSAEAMAPLGMLARPVDPETANDGSPEVASEALLMTVGDRLYAIALNDPRTMKDLPPLKKGGFITYCPASPGSFGIFDGLDPKGVNRAGSFTLSTKYTSGSNKRAHLLQMDVRTDGQEAVSLKHGEGMGLQITSGGLNSAVLRNAAGNAFVETNDEGLVFAGKVKAQGSMVVGQMAAASGLLKADTFEAYITALESAITGLGGIIPVRFSAAKALLVTSHLKSS
jgi:hypothetical protein